jgi:hypothetical protein
MASASHPVSDSPLQAGQATTVRLYSNHLLVRQSLSEVHLDFGQLFSDSGLPFPLARLVTSPLHLRLFQQELTGALDSYEATYGALPPLPHDVTEH